jgi:hypothetical protein
VSSARLDAELIEFLESGVSLLVGACSAEGEPSCLHGVGARVSREDSLVSVYLTEALAQRLIGHLRENPRIAVTFSRAFDHRSLQLKGNVTSIERTSESGKEIQERYLATYGTALLTLGFPKEVATHIAYWPSVEVTFRPTSVFEQTPGPRAGSLLGE